MVDIWYPSDEKRGQTAPYIDVAGFDRALGAMALQALLGGRAANLVRSGSIQTHAIERAPFTRRLNRSPVLIFSHGMGTVTQVYTAQLEDLVSHGDVVVALTHPYDAWLTLLPDGRSIPFEQDRRNAAGNSEDQQIVYENTRVEWWANHIRFVLQELARQNRSRQSEIPFAGRLDLQRVGAFGHSVGGRAAARACQLDRRLRACADQDGLAMMLPFYVDKKGAGMNQPFLLIDREIRTAPTDDDLRQMGLTRPELEAMVARLRADRDAALAATGGSYRVVLDFPTTNHMSFSDVLMLQARDAAEASQRTRVFKVTSAYTRAFFDKCLRNLKAPLLDNGEAPSEFIDRVQHYSRAPLRK